MASDALAIPSAGSSDALFPEASRKAKPLYIVAIAWLYVTLLMAFTEHSVTAGVLTFFFYGVFPLAIVLWLMGTPGRRRRRMKDREASGAGQGARVPGHGDAAGEE